MFDFWHSGSGESEAAGPRKGSWKIQKLPSLGLEHFKGKSPHQKPQTELSIGGELSVRCDKQERKKTSKPKGKCQTAIILIKSTIFPPPEHRASIIVIHSFSKHVASVIKHIQSSIVDPMPDFVLHVTDTRASYGVCP